MGNSELHKIWIAGAFLIFVLIASCIQKPSTGPSDFLNNTNSPISIFPIKKEPIQYADEAIVRANLAKSEEVKLFLGLYPGAQLSLNKSELPLMWIASYDFQKKNLKVSLNHTTGEILFSNIPIEYLRSGKFCRVSQDCSNIGDINGALCINRYYSLKDGAACDANQVACSRSIECCSCVKNYCTKQDFFPTAQKCQVGYAVNASGNLSAIPKPVSITLACNSITELTVGQKVTSENATLEFLGVYDQNGVSVGK